LYYRYCVHTYVNGKIVTVEAILGMEWGRIKENNGGCEFRYDIFDIM
jgi:hypothetical protein